MVPVLCIVYQPSNPLRCVHCCVGGRRLTFSIRLAIQKWTNVNSPLASLRLRVHAQEGESGPILNPCTGYSNLESRNTRINVGEEWVDLPHRQITAANYYPAWNKREHRMKHRCLWVTKVSTTPKALSLVHQPLLRDVPKGTFEPLISQLHPQHFETGHKYPHYSMHLIIITTSLAAKSSLTGRRHHSPLNAQCRASTFIFLVAYTSGPTFSVLYVLLIISIKAWFSIPRLKLTV